MHFRRGRSRALPGAVVGAVALAVAGLPTLASAASLPPASGVTLPALAATTTLYVATNGNDTNPGTLAAPFATVQKAVGLVKAGGTVAVRGGTYQLAGNIQITKSGTAAAPITLTNYGTEKVVLDGEALAYTPGAVGSTIPSAQRGVIHMEASRWKLVGLEIAHGPYGVYCNACTDNTFERLVTRDNYETGFQLQGASSNNLILNLDSYGNHDPRKNGESADGLGIKEGSGTGNVVRGARLWNNVDDGFDAWTFSSPITIQDTLAYGNGYNRWNIPNFSGDGNGFKLGGSSGTGPAAGHTVTNAMAFGNAASGFTDNGNTGAITIDHSTAYQNARTGFDVDGGSKSRLTADLAIGNKTAVTLGSSTASGNSWNLGGTWTLRSTDPSTATGPRNSDGSIRSSTFLVPANGSSVGART
ncbi:right-handed parallel beta-helix repeat-containing protein [Paractinoplanes ferrugineus]|uniref:Pectate lyase n=1 Tax=Paractinoplanes ferrugineus TaxID=113564 RepID=A0A919JAF7_9ACTN|nr:right-handed parallel beta-helix repeat-containing protein [Actinoplanes ferrugineus]GIE13566.1 pectate lyase [Actinoplanes ferrugineus]